MADQPEANCAQKEAQTVTKHGKKRPRTPKDRPADDCDDPDWEPGSSQQLCKKKAAAGAGVKHASRGESSWISSLDSVEEEGRFNTFFRCQKKRLSLSYSNTCHRAQLMMF